MDPADAAYALLARDPRPLTLCRVWEDSQLPPPPPADGSQRCPVKVWLDRHELNVRIDGVDERLTPFLPFVKALSVREMERVRYGIMLSAQQRTLLVSEAPPTEPAAEEVSMYLISLANVNTEAGTKSFEVRLHFRLLFGRMGPGSAEPRSFGLRGVYATGDRSPLHEDCRALRANQQKIEGYTRFRPENCVPLQHRSAVWSEWKSLTQNSTISAPNGTDDDSEDDDDKTTRAEGGTVRCGYSVPEMEGADVLDYVDPSAPPSSSFQFGIDFIPRRCSYADDRMATRLAVVQRPTGAKYYDLWETTAAELAIAFDSKSAPEPQSVAKVFFREQRGSNTLEGGELTAYPPPDIDLSADARLRLWVCHAVLTAEVHAVRQLVIPIDTGLLLSRCVGLSGAGGSGFARDSATVPFGHQRVLEGVLEALSEIIRTSGTVWRVVLMTDTAEAAAVAQDMLVRIRFRDGDHTVDVPAKPSIGCGIVSSPDVKRRRVAAEFDKRRAKSGSRPHTSVPRSRAIAPTPRRALYGTEADSTTATPARQLLADATTPPPDASPMPAGIPNMTESPRPQSRQPVRPVTAPARSPSRGPVSDNDITADAIDAGNIIVQAACTGRPIDEEEVVELFHALDRDQNGKLDPALIQRVLRKAPNPDAEDTTPDSLRTGGILAPTDSCGLDGKEWVAKLVRRHCHGSMMVCDEFVSMMMELARL